MRIKLKRLPLLGWRKRKATLQLLTGRYNRRIIAEWFPVFITSFTQRQGKNITLLWII